MPIPAELRDKVSAIVDEEITRAQRARADHQAQQAALIVRDVQAAAAPPTSVTTTVEFRATGNYARDPGDPAERYTRVRIAATRYAPDPDDPDASLHPYYTAEVYVPTRADRRKAAGWLTVHEDAARALVGRALA